MWLVWSTFSGQRSKELENVLVSPVSGLSVWLKKKKLEHSENKSCTKRHLYHTYCIKFDVTVCPVEVFCGQQQHEEHLSFANAFTPMLESLRIHKQPICPSLASFSNYAVISFEVALWGVTWAYLRDGQDGPLQNHAGVIMAIFSLVLRPNPFLQVECIALWFIST